MACFIVPTTEAIITTVAKKVVQSRETAPAEPGVIPFSQKLGWLNKMLWGGSALLAFEHLWHGEISPFYPFLTAASETGGLSAVLHEMATVGVGMAVRKLPSGRKILRLLVESLCAVQPAAECLEANFHWP